MRAKALTISLLTGVTLLTACSTTSQIAVRPDTTSKIKTVALIKVAEPTAYVTNDFGNPAAAFGAIGGAVAGASSADAAKSLRQITQEYGFTAGAELTRSLQEKLTNAGYQVKLISVERGKPGKLIEDYSSVDAGGADAIMDVAIETIGYATEHPMFSPHWRPASTVYVALVDSRTHEKLYAEKFMYGYHNPFMSGTDIDAPSTYHFKNRDSLFSDGKKLVAGMEDSVTSVSGSVVSKLSK
jgi:hypothetical protein